ncbi:MAG: hypothetical protein KDJ27_08420 [Gammaproteobacteria bacterium]|nr:hypothetical protein [Gammaproteobacteria bacterium]
MRGLVVFLLIANLVLYLWVRHENMASAVRAELPPPEIGTLKLRNEAEDAASADAVLPPAAVDDPGIDVAVAERATELTVSSEPEAPAPENLTHETTPVSGAPERDEAVLPQPQPQPQPQPRPQPQPQPQPATDAAMVGEPLPADSVDSPSTLPQATQASARQEASAAAPDPDLPAARLCVRVGPLLPADADEVLQKLPEDVRLLSDTPARLPVPTGYYVMIPALPDRPAGIAKVGELRAAGFEDVWLFRGGEFRNAISLGLFSSEVGAERHALRVRDKGFDVAVLPKTSVRDVRWLLVEHDRDLDLAAKLPLPQTATLAAQDCP